MNTSHFKNMSLELAKAVIQNHDSALAPTCVFCAADENVSETEHSQDCAYLMAKNLIAAADTDWTGTKQPEGMPVEQEPKYGIRDNRIYNRSSGEYIPVDEPVFIFRGRDIRAIFALNSYANRVNNDDHRKAIASRIKAFSNFLDAQPGLMKEPDTDPSVSGVIDFYSDVFAHQDIVKAVITMRDSYAEAFAIAAGTARPWLTSTGWVSVSDALPRKIEGSQCSDDVLVINADSSLVCVSMAKLQFFENDESEWQGHRVTHWMPAPIWISGPLAPATQSDKLLFEQWAKIEGLSIESGKGYLCSDGRFPATYLASETESAWRAYTNKFMSIEDGKPFQRPVVIAADVSNSVATKLTEWSQAQATPPVSDQHAVFVTNAVLGLYFSSIAASVAGELQ